MVWGRRARSCHRESRPSGPPRSNRKVQHTYGKVFYRQRHKIENVFGRLTHWRRVATRYDRCPHTCMSANCIAATVACWL
ncbi:MAG: transposase [Rhodospirillaceae bacterium]|nr:transposase [Rhodospirillaceae bacterium]MBT6202957.1 transposase [Rhodospirillaceae bacterium]MBT7613514.1 transposase [Rhodospirillaceae bacterium]